MSRSYKKHPICKQGGHAKKFFKRQANKRVRKTINIPNGSLYRNMYDSWTICDYRIYCPLTDFLFSRFDGYVYNFEYEMDWERHYFRK